MRGFSRTMPAFRKPEATPLTPGARFVLWLAGAGFVAGLAWFAYNDPAALAGTLGVITFFYLVAWLNTLRIKAARAGEDIGTFARSFDYRNVDPWVLRAVYEETATEVEYPVLADDRLRDVFADGLDLNDALDRMAFRARRSLDGAEVNPFYDRVERVRDLVHFLDHQPPLAGA